MRKKFKHRYIVADQHFWLQKIVNFHELSSSTPLKAITTGLFLMDHCYLYAYKRGKLIGTCFLPPILFPIINKVLKSRDCMPLREGEPFSPAAILWNHPIIGADAIRLNKRLREACIKRRQK